MRVKISEDKLRNVIKNQILQVLKENEEEEGLSEFGKSLSAGLKAGAAAMRGNYQASKDMDDLYGANSNVDAEQRLRDIDNACRELRKQYTSLLAQRKQLEAFCNKKGIASLTRKPFQKNKTNSLPISTSTPNKFGSRKYGQSDGNIGDLTTQGIGRGV